MPVSLPRFIKKAFATDGLKTAIPDASNNATGRAGYDHGFPPINMQPKEAGGIPPRGEDMNGVIYDVTLAISYIQSGKSFPFNSDFATAIGGYPVGAVVSDASNPTLWFNGVSNNSAFPVGWTNFSFSDPTETVRGAPFVSTQAEVNNGVDDTKVVTSKKLRNGFSFSSATNGHIALPSWMGGMIFQWGVIVITPNTTPVGGAYQTVVNSSYPLAFPNGASLTFGGLLDGGSALTWSQATAWVDGLTNSTLRATIVSTYPRERNGSCWFFAIGR